jgi:chromosome segregation ATPase
MNPEVHMSGDDDTMKLTTDDGSLTGDALLHAVRGDMQSLFDLVRALNEKVDARLHDTRPIWEAVASRLEAIEIEQKSQGARLDSMEAEQSRQGVRLDAIEARLDAIEVKFERFDTIETELRRLRRRIERMVGKLSHDLLEVQAAQQDLEDQVEKLENTTA